jgi:hypothetical protein
LFYISYHFRYARARTPGRTPGARFNSDEALLLQPVEIYCRIRPIDEGKSVACTQGKIRLRGLFSLLLG